MTLPASGGLDLLMILLKGTVLLIVAIGLTAALRRSPAGARHLVWLATLATVVLFPVLTRWEPLRLEVLPPFIAVPQTIGMTPTPAATSPLATSPDATRELAAPAQHRAVEVSRTSIDLPDPATVLLFAWLAGAAMLIAWLAAGMLAVRRIVRRGRLLEDSKWTTPLYEVADRMNLETVPRIVESDRVEMPFACGIFRPTIVFPASANAWNDERRRVVLFHELAHIHRRDLIGHALGRLACALYWFHPLVWTAARQLRAESERACDDLVLACGARASDYVGHLLDIVTSVRRSGAPVTAVPMARKKEFEGRMLAILDPTIPRGAPGRVQSVGILATMLVITLSVAAAVPATPVGSTALAAAVPAVAADTGVRTAFDTATSPTPHADSKVERVQTQVTQRVAESTRLQIESRTTDKQDAPSQPERSSSASSVPSQPGDRVEALIKVLSTDSDADVRISAAWALARWRDARATDALREATRKDTKSHVREMAAWGLIQSGGATPALLAEVLRQDESSQVRETAAWGLGQIGGASASPALVAAIHDESAEVRRTAIWALGNMRSREPATAIADALKDEDDEVRLQAAWALGQLLSPSTIPALRSAFAKETDTEARRAMFRALAFLGDDSEEFIALAMKSPDPELRSRAVRMIAGQGAGIWPWPWPWPRPRPSP